MDFTCLLWQALNYNGNREIKVHPFLINMVKALGIDWENDIGILY